jgi:putative NADH-flavin reductase
MKLTVIGASGRTGSLVVHQALEAGHQVTAIVRDPGKLDVAGPDLDVVVADPMRPEAIVDAIAGRDVVVSALGAPDRNPTTVCQNGTRSAIQAMRQAGVRRLVVVSVAAIHTTGDGPFTRSVVKPLLGRMLRNTNADADAMERIVEASDLDWTIVCPPRLTDGTRAGNARRRLDRTVPRASISRADLAAEILGTLDDETTVGHRLFVGTGRF